MADPRRNRQILQGLRATENAPSPRNRADRQRRRIGAKQRERILERDGHRCKYCGRHEDECPGGLTLDHVNPIKNGGTNEDRNLVACCADCNLKKGGRTRREASALGLRFRGRPQDGCPSTGP